MRQSCSKICPLVWLIWVNCQALSAFASVFPFCCFPRFLVPFKTLPQVFLLKAFLLQDRIRFIANLQPCLEAVLQSGLRSLVHMSLAL